MAPKIAIHAKLRWSCGIACRKKRRIAPDRITRDLTSRGLFLMKYCQGKKKYKLFQGSAGMCAKQWNLLSVSSLLGFLRICLQQAAL